MTGGGHRPDCRPMNEKLKSPLFHLTILVALAGALLPAWSLVRSGGLRGSMNDAGLMVVLWGMSPFVLPIISAWIARRPWVQVMVLALVGVAFLFGLTNYLVVQPNQDASRATASYFLLPIWQWPMAVLGAGLALFVPSAAEDARAETLTPTGSNPPA